MNKVHEWPVRVYHAETDADGIVHHSRYLHFFERARAELIRAQGFTLTMLAQRGVKCVIQHISLHYCRPALLDEALIVETTVIRQRRCAVTLQQALRCQQNDEMVCHAQIVVVCVDACQHHPVVMPQGLFGFTAHSDL